MSDNSWKSSLDGKLETTLASEIDTFETELHLRQRGKLELRKMVEDLIEMPPYQTAPDLYRDWGDPREYTIGDLGVGECAGEVVPFVEFGLAAAERQVFEASTLLEGGNAEAAAERAYRAMLHAAQALARHVGAFVSDEPDDIVAKFCEHLVEPKFFWDPFAGEKFVHYLTRVHGKSFAGIVSEKAHQRIEEAQLFVDASHQAYGRVGEARKKAATAPQGAAA